MAQTFKSGDTVRLKSGGPLMTVENYYRGINDELKTVETELANCVWFEGNTTNRDRFHQDLLEADTDEIQLG